MAVNSSQESLPLSQETENILYSLLGTSLTTLATGVHSDMQGEVYHPEQGTLPQLKTFPLPQFPCNISPNLPELSRQSSSLPASTIWPGQYEFNFSIPFQANEKKSPWVFSEEMNKLYVQKSAAFQLNFSTNGIIAMPGDVYIRAMVLFCSSDSAADVVKRCLNHSVEELQKNVFEAEHILRCESNGAVYDMDISGRHSVVVPYEIPPEGQNFSSYIFKFMCYSSCSGGPNRRPMMVIFTLERGGTVIGRQKVDVKICACPQRDLRSDSEIQEKMKSAPVDASGDICTEVNHKKLKMETKHERQREPEQRRMIEPEPEDEEKSGYTLKVYDKKQYRFLRKMQKFHTMAAGISRKRKKPMKVAMKDLAMYFVLCSSTSGNTGTTTSSAEEIC